MKTQTDSLKLRKTYQPPRAEIIGMVTQSVLCNSALIANTTEAVTTETFVFP